MAKRHTNHSETIRKFDRTRMKYNRIRTMNQMLDLFQARAGEFVSFADIEAALAPTHRINIYQAHADLRRLGLRTCVSRENDLRFQYSTSSQ